MRIDIAVQTPTSKSVRVAQVSSMFDVPPSEISRVEWHGDVPIEERDWNVGLIVGPSASGKSIILREKFGVPEQYTWQAASILDEFDVSFSLDEITEICQAVGFNTIPAWMKPFHALSNGEQFRVELARRLIEGVDKPQVVCDEFTSVVDRQVAQIGANAVQKYIRRAKRKFVAATCHYDLEAWLQPDWVLEPATMTFRWRELQRRPPVQCQIARVENSAWHHFSRFHYMSAELHRGARVYVLFVEGVPAACCAALFRPHPKVQNVYGMSRLVTLPDFQGLGLAFVLCDRVASLYKAQGWRYRAYPAHPGLVRSFDRSKAWKMTIKPGMSLTNRANMAITGMFGGRPNATFEYVGPMGDRTEADSLLGMGKNPL